MSPRSGLPEPGEVFAGRYAVERVLARGGMAVVYAAKHLGTEREVALKVLYPHVLASEDAVEGFRNEARLATRIGGPHVVEVIDAGFDAELEIPYLVMERLVGETLGAMIARRGALPPAQALPILQDIADGLARAHDHQEDDGRPSPVVHRDLKPDNVFVVHRGGGTSAAKILDFGIAKVLRDATAVTRQVKGTPMYMSFEQAARSRVTPQTDLWALGLTAFFVMTGRTYWRSGTDSDGSTIGLFAEVLSLPLVTASARAREYGLDPPWPPAFDAWFARCVHRETDARFRSAREASDALERALNASAIQTPPPGSVTATTTPGAATIAPAGKSARGLVAGLVATTVVAGVVAVAFVRLRAPTGAPPVADPPASAQAPSPSAAASASASSGPVVLAAPDAPSATVGASSRGAGGTAGAAAPAVAVAGPVAPARPAARSPVAAGSAPVQTGPVAPTKAPPATDDPYKRLD